MQPEGLDDSPLEPVASLFETASPPRPTREPFWGYLDLLFVLLLVALGSLLIIVTATFLVHGDIARLADSPELVWPTSLGLYVVVYLALRLVIGTRYGAPVFASLGWRRTSFSLPLAAIGGVLLAFALSGLAYLLHTPKVKTPFDKLADTPFSFLLLAVTAVAIAPVFEELFFRGFMQPLFCRTLGIPAGVVVTAIFFGSLHASEYMQVWQYVAAVSVVGIVLGSLRVWTKSIIPGIVMHGCFNAVSVMALAFSKYLHK
ncbi:MAG TPA: type II CAAX endopeptidase family protein [Bryobacteraceae bacterium]